MQILFFGGPIITMEEEKDHPEAVLIEDGKIKKVGSLKQLELAANKHVVRRDLKGKCLMPAFIDAHGHITMNGQMSVCADVSECGSFEEIADNVSHYIKEHNIGPQNAVLGFGYDHNFLKEKQHPDKAVLDKISNVIPIMLLHVSGHLACVNSVALEMAGITENTANPSGGVIGRIEGTNIPNGYLEEAGMTMVQQIMAKRIKINPIKVMNDMQQIYIENGITTVQDGAATEQSIKMLKILAGLHRLKVDVVVYPLMNENVRDIFVKNKKRDNCYKNHLKLGGYKIILDGSPQGRSAWMSEPYLGGETDYCGYPWMKDEKTEKYVQQAIEDRKQILAHCNGDAASEQFLNAYEKGVKTCRPAKDLRPVMIHCQTVRNDQLDRMAKLHMIASVFVGHVFYWGDIHIKNLGEARGNHISPVKDALQRNITVNFHQDTPVTKPKMLHSVWCAVNRISREGNSIGKEQKVSVYEALKAVTINGAYEYFEEQSKGSIKEGKRADLVILDQSPLIVDVMKIKDIQVMETIKDGKTIYKRR